MRRSSEGSDTGAGSTVGIDTEGATVEDAEAAADGRFTVAEYVVRETDTRRNSKTGSLEIGSRP
jgi:hypothetical protein